MQLIIKKKITIALSEEKKDDKMSSYLQCLKFHSEYSKCAYKEYYTNRAGYKKYIFIYEQIYASTNS